MSKHEATALALAAAVLEAIAGLGTVPSGHLYARLMSTLTYDQYTALIAALVTGGLITNKNNVLTITDKGSETAAQTTAAYRARQ